MLSASFFHRIIDWHTEDGYPTFAWAGPRQDLGSILQHEFGVKAPLSLCYPLNQHRRVLVPNYAEAGFTSFFAISTAFLAASSMLSITLNLASLRIRFPSSWFVPAILIIIAFFQQVDFNVSTMALATSSQ